MFSSLLLPYWREERRKSVGGVDPFSTIWMLVMAVYFSIDHHHLLHSFQISWWGRPVDLDGDGLISEQLPRQLWCLWSFWLHFLSDSHLTNNSENMAHLAKAFTYIPIHLLMSLSSWSWDWWVWFWSNYSCLSGNMMCVWGGSSVEAWTCFLLPDCQCSFLPPKVLVANPEWGSAVKHLASTMSCLLLQFHYNYKPHGVPSQEWGVGIHTTNCNIQELECHQKRTFLVLQLIFISISLPLAKICSDFPFGFTW